VRLTLAAINATEKAAGDLGEADIRRPRSMHGVSNLRTRLGTLSRFFDWCHDAGDVPANPCAQIFRARRPKTPPQCAHYLTLPALARLWKVDAKAEPIWCDLARFLIAVPCRRGDAVRLERSHLDLTAAEWRQPRQMTKNREPRRLHLRALALEVLNARREALATAHQAMGDRANQHSVRIDDLWRICFVWNEGAHEVEICRPSLRRP